MTTRFSPGRQLLTLLITGLSFVSLVCVTEFSIAADEPRFSLDEHTGDCVDVNYGGKTVARYCFAYQPDTPESLHQTYKPYLHIFDAAGEKPITKGAGGQYTHHRGIFIGWSKIRHEGNTYDRWHMRGGEIVHKEFLKEQADSDHATITSRTEWHGKDRTSILSEKRTMTVRKGVGPVRLIVDFQSELTPTGSKVVLNGDPEHAGIQFRPSNNVDRKQTTFHFPSKDANPKKDRDYPWVGETFVLDGDKHTVLHVNHPSNPKETIYSAYRDYGRFGAFFETEIPAGETLTVRYRFLILKGEMPETEVVTPLIEDFRESESHNG